MYVNAKMIPFESIPGMGVGNKGEKLGAVNSSMIMIYLIHFINATMYPHPAQQ
jgi:hypothetical protein